VNDNARVFQLDIKRPASPKRLVIKIRVTAGKGLTRTEQDRLIEIVQTCLTDFDFGWAPTADPDDAMQRRPTAQLKDIGRYEIHRKLRGGTVPLRAWLLEERGVARVRSRLRSYRRRQKAVVK
jgi:hypothetical protein